MLAAVGQCMGGAERKQDGQEAPTAMQARYCEGVSNVTVTGQLQQVNGQTTAVHPCNGTLLIFHRLITTKAWMNFKCIIQVKEARPKKAIYVWVHLYDILRKANIEGQNNRSVVDSS